MFATCRGQLILQLMFVSSLVLVNSAGVFRQGETSVKEHHHEKRQNKAINGFNKEEKAAILEKHNHLRALTEASNMLKLTWDPQLESHAQNYAAQCKFAHNSNRRTVAGFQYVGENLYAGTGDFAPEAVVQYWYDEIKDYDYSSGLCRPRRACGHYTQIVWANTRAVGCGVKYCERFNQANSIGFSQGYLVVCNYGPGGNWVGEKPYEAGTPCSQCPGGTTCSQGLCGQYFSDAGVYRQGETSGKGDHREKRLSEAINGFNAEQRKAILEQHNHFRALTKASNMLKLTWDPQLESRAQNYAAQCKFEHNPNKENVAGFQYVGENLYAGTGDFDPKAVVQQWHDEINDYDYSSNTCTPGKACGHYTQVVWANTRAVGCGVKYCPRFNQGRIIGFTEGILVVCNYGPGGNWVGEKPYEAGTPCSLCPGGTTSSQGLCAGP